LAPPNSELSPGVSKYIKKTQLDIYWIYSELSPGVSEYIKKTQLDIYWIYSELSPGVSKYYQKNPTGYILDCPWLC
jgi:hypothetical protein